MSKCNPMIKGKHSLEVFFFNSYYHPFFNNEFSTQLLSRFCKLIRAQL